MTTTRGALGSLRNRLLTGVGVVALGATGWMAPALAQEEGASEGRETIVVTSRKREETLQEAPLAITAFGAEDIEEADITSLEDISTFAAGFQFANQGGQQPGRYNTQLRFRGQSTAQFSPTFATGALFVDGVYVLNGGTSLSLMDIERVEVIKGPQSAYFGRNTFGGAVNFITSNPSLTTYGGTLQASATDRERFDVSGIVDIPLIQDVAALSLSGRWYDKAGHYMASDGGRLGDEETHAFNAKLYAEPTPNLSFTARASFSTDDDGGPAGGFVSGSLNDTCTGTTLTRPGGAIANPTRYICGQVPGLDDAITFTGGPVIDMQTTPFSTVASNPSYYIDGIQDNPVQANIPSINRIGLARETTRLSFAAAYEMGNYTLDFVAGYNQQYANWIRDFDLTARDRTLSRDPQSIEDQSFEFRITSPQDQRFRWLAGVNYYTQEFTASGEGGDFGTSCFVFGDNPLSDVPGSNDETGCAFASVFGNGFGGTDEAEVLGLFGAVDFDVTDQITVSLEGRQQDDTLTKGGGTVSGLTAAASEFEFSKFLPRVIVRYQPTDATNLYFSYSEGILPGDVGGADFARGDAQERAQYLAQFPSIQEVLPPEELTAYEIGLKQQFFDGRWQMNFSYWWNEWTGIKGRSTAIIQETCDAQKLGEPGCQFAGVTLGDLAQVLNPGTGLLEPFRNSRNVLIPGDAELNGFEFENTFQITDGWSAALNIARASSEYTDYEFNFVAPFAGFSDMTGNQVPRFPEWSGNASSTYTARLNAAYDWYVRGDVSYFGEAFVDESNLAYTEDYFLANMRFGIVNDTLRLEAFVNNLFDEDAYGAGARWTDFSRPTNFGTLTLNQGVAVSALDKREIGVRVSKTF